MDEHHRDLVVAKVKQCFPTQETERVLAILDLYGSESYEQGRERVQLAILKLSSGDMERLRENVKAAKSDFRDVLAYAEYPEEMDYDTWKMTDQGDVKKIRERDRQRYLDWLHD